MTVRDSAFASPQVCAYGDAPHKKNMACLHCALCPAGEGVEPSKLMYSYYTAGSGGAGPTILATTFLLAGEEAIVYREGKKYTYPPLSNRREVDFGPGA